MKRQIKIVYSILLVIFLSIGMLPTTCLAKTVFNNQDALLADINKDVTSMYGKEGYYTYEKSISGTKRSLRTDLLAKGVDFANHIAAQGTSGIEQGEYRKFRLAYGSGFTVGASQGVDEYYGYNPDGALVENPDYHWNSWDGVMIQNRSYVHKPWLNSDKITVRNVEMGSFNKHRNVVYTCPDGTKKALADAIQTGMNIRYGGQPASAVVYNCSSSQIVYEKDAKPRQGGEWIEYVDVVQPPTYYSWGQGYMYLGGGTRYMGVDIAPYCMVGPDLSVSFDGSLPGKTKTGTAVSLSASGISNFSRNSDTSYRWTVTGKTTGSKITAAYKVNDQSAGDNGSCVIPAKGSKAGFKIGFNMPEEPVIVTLEINYKEPRVEEADFSNNKITYVVDWQPYYKTETDLTLHYNELTREVQHAITKSGTSASVSKPKGDWDGDASGGLNVTLGNTSGILQNAHIKQGTNDPVTGEVTSATRNPVLTGTIVRKDFGDNPDSYYAPNSKDSVVKSFRNTFSGQMQRPWKYVYTTTTTSTDSEGKTHTTTETHTETGTSTGEFVPGENSVNVKVEIYNGLQNKDMPSVAARAFKKQIDNNTADSRNKTIWWESDKYPMKVQRWMAHVYLEQPTAYEAVNGQYDRIFSQQNKAKVTWKTEKNMASFYSSDRNNAKNGRTDKGSYQYVPFATDKELQGVAYPFKSGYYFNPAGQYSVTLETEIYKDTQGETQEHKEMVNELIKSFRYNSTMTYKQNDSTGSLLLKIDNPQSSRSEEKSAEGLLTAYKDYSYVKDYEIMYSPNSSGYTHDYFKEILEGYEESNTAGSKNKYSYREYIKEGSIYKIIEKTTITFKVNENNKAVYTYGGMKNGTYYSTAWAEGADIASITKVSSMNLAGVKGTAPLDHIDITVQGSMYDDLNN